MTMRLPGADMTLRGYSRLAGQGSGIDIHVNMSEVT